MRHQAVLHRSTSLGPVVLRPGGDRPERLEGMGAVVLELLALLDGPADEATIAEQLAAVAGGASGGGPSAAEVGAVLVELERRGLAFPAPSAR